jgi:periplasmic protein TonB
LPFIEQETKIMACLKACLDDAGLQQYLEVSEPSPLRRMVEARLTSCARCRATFDRVIATHRRVNGWLGRLTVSGDSAEVNSGAALARVLARAEAGNMFRSDPGVSWNFKALATSFLFQGAAVAVLVLLGASQVAHTTVRQMTLLAPPPPVKHPKLLKSNAGAGGGQHSPLPPLKGPLPKPAPRVFTPPPVTIEHPALVMDASLIAPPDSWAAPTSAIGNPLGVFNGGLGAGNHGDAGPGDGGTGTGTRGSGAGGDASEYSAGRGITAPSILSKVEPEYSEEARKAKYSGAVMLAIVVNTDGRADDIRVIKSLGMGLDEKAIEAVQRWRFRPGTKDGVPARVRAQIEVNFRLL